MESLKEEYEAQKNEKRERFYSLTSSFLSSNPWLTLVRTNELIKLTPFFSLFPHLAPFLVHVFSNIAISESTHGLPWMPPATPTR